MLAKKHICFGRNNSSCSSDKKEYYAQHQVVRLVNEILVMKGLKGWDGCFNK